MKRESALYGIIGLLAGAIIAWAIAAVSVNNNYTGMMNMIGIHSKNDNHTMMDDNSMSMDEMANSLKSKTGDEFDKAFLATMIEHHQGAIDMAKLAQTNAKHQEIKDMADGIISAQSKEIDQMQSWQTEWGYKTTPQSHDMMTMSH